MNIDFSTLPLWLNKAFYPLWFDHNRFIVLKGGAGSGKSVDTFRRLVYRLIAEPGHNYLIARKSAKSNSTSTYPLTKSCIADWNFEHLFHEHKTTQTITSKTNGNQVKFIGLDDMEKIKSITFNFGIISFNHNFTVGKLPHNFPAIIYVPTEFLLRNQLRLAIITIPPLPCYSI